MATLLQYPDALSLSGNLKKIIISSSVKTQFALYKGETKILDEEYLPDSDDRINIDIRDIVTSSLYIDMPITDAYSQTRVADNFTIYLDGSATAAASFRAMRCGVERFSGTASNFLTANFLTWQPQSKQVTADQPEWLTYYFTEEGTVKAKFYNTDGTSKVITLCSGTAGTCKTVRVQWSFVWPLGVTQVDGEDLERYGYFDVWVEDTNEVQLSYTQRYIFRAAEALDQVYICKNSLGGIDTFLLSGERKFVPEMDHTLAEYDEKTISADIDGKRRWAQSTGAMGKSIALWAWELLHSKDAYYLLEGTITAIALDSSSIEESNIDNIKNYTFEYRMSEDLGLLKISRSSSLPTNLEVVSPDSELFFLVPRLVDFPEAVADDSLLLPVQSPFLQSWRKFSFGGLKNWIIDFLSGTSIGQSTHNHANKTIIDKFSQEPTENVSYEGAELAKKNEHIRKDVEDTAAEKMTFEKGVKVVGKGEFDRIESDNFVGEGFAGSGFSLKKKADGSTSLYIDELTVRKSAMFYELVIQQIKHQGGIVFYTAAAIECNRVTTLTDCYRCYFDNKGDQLTNEFAVGDQARCQRFTAGTTTKYFWRLVVAVGDDYVDLSKADCDSGSSNPSKGDIIVQFGNRNDTARQSAKITTVIGNNAPRDEYYQGISSYSLNGKLVTVVGMNDGAMGVYTENGRFSGEVVIGANSAGLENLAEWGDVQSSINNAHNKIDTNAAIVGLLTQDDVFDVIEKATIRTEWEAVNGVASTNLYGTSGSYYNAKELLLSSGFQGNLTNIIYDSDKLIFNNKVIQYNYIGKDALDMCYDALRSYLSDMELYHNNYTVGFDREYMAKLFTQYYDVLNSLLDVINKHRVDNIEEHINTITPFNLDLTNENASVACNSEGVVVGTLPTSQVYVYYGAALDSGWTYTLGCTGCTATIDNGGNLTITTLTSDNAVVIISASKGSYPTLTKNMTITKVKAGAKGEQGLQGLQGIQGLNGEDGANGQTSYFHIKYAPVSNPTADQMTEIPNKYIGTYVDFTQADSANPSAYNWYEWKGLQGDDGKQGIPGTNGANGKTSYLHIKYSDDGGISFTANNGETPGKYIGQYTDFTLEDSANVNSYTWSKAKGDDAILYWLEPYCNVIKKSWEGTLLPATITCRKMKVIGGGTAAETNEKILKYRLSDGNETAYSGAVTINASTEWIDFILYDGNTVLDKERIPVLVDASELNVEAINVAIENLQQQTDTTAGIVANMNNDSVLDKTEKVAIRTQYELINGLASLYQIGVVGSYMNTLDILAKSQYPGYAVKMLLNTNIITYNGYALNYNYSGKENLTVSFNNLRKYLIDVDLYSSMPFMNFNREYLSALFTSYYDAQQRLLDDVSKYYVDDAITDFEYLKEMMPLDATVDAYNGILLAALLGVKDEARNVVAGIAGQMPNGFSEFPMLWGGGTSVALANQAKWRVYKNGKQILGLYNGKRIEIIPDTGATNPNPRIEIYDEEGNIASIFDGSKINSISDLFGTGANITLTNKSCAVVGNHDNRNTQQQESLENYRITLEKDGVMTIASVQLQGAITGSYTEVGGEPTLIPGGYVRLIVDGVTLESIYIDNISSVNRTFTNIKVALSAGTHIVKTSFLLFVPNILTGSLTLTGSSTFTGISTLVYDVKKTRYFSNGFAVGSSNTNYIMALNAASGLNLKAESGDAGIELINGTIKIKLNNVWYNLSRNGGYLMAN